MPSFEELGKTVSEYYKFGFRYVVELGGVSYDERGYLRSHYTKLLGKEPKTSYKWTNLRNATQFYTEQGARQGASESGLDGLKVVIKTRAFDQNTMKPYNSPGLEPWLWECKGSI